MFTSTPQNFQLLNRETIFLLDFTKLPIQFVGNENKAKALKRQQNEFQIDKKTQSMNIGAVFLYFFWNFLFLFRFQIFIHQIISESHIMKTLIFLSISLSLFLVLSLVNVNEVLCLPLKLYA